MQPATYKTVIGHDFQIPDCLLQAATVPDFAATDEVWRYIQIYAAQVEQWRQMVNAEDIPKQQLLESLDDNYFKRQLQTYINYAKGTSEGLIQHLYDDYGTILPMDI